MKKSLAILLISFVIGFSIGFLISNPTITGQSIFNNKYTYTTAICDQENKCIDVLIKCENNQVTELTPITNLIDLGSDWKDFRPEKESFC
jgi:hypothetical protein